MYLANGVIDLCAAVVYYTVYTVYVYRLRFYVFVNGRKLSILWATLYKKNEDLLQLWTGCERISELNQIFADLWCAIRPTNSRIISLTENRASDVTDDDVFAVRIQLSR